MQYGLNRETERIDYEEVLRLALQHKPKAIIVGASSYPFVIDFKRFRDIADESGSLLIADMAHIAGLIAADEHPSPVPYADVVTSTTHKTLRGPRGGLIISNNEAMFSKLQSSIIPGT